MPRFATHRPSRRLTAVLALVLIALGLAAAACGNSSSCGRGHHQIPCDSSYAVGLDERRDIAKHADATAQALADAGWVITARLTPSTQGEGWRFRYTLCATSADTGEAKKCNQAKAAPTMPRVTRNIKVTGRKFHFQNYPDTLVYASADRITCKMVGPVTVASLQALVPAFDEHGYERPGTKFAIPRTGAPVFDCTVA